jgi:hypothetical protein
MSWDQKGGLNEREQVGVISRIGDSQDEKDALFLLAGTINLMTRSAVHIDDWVDLQ